MIDCSTSLLMESPPYRVWPAGYCRDLTCVSHAPLSVSAYPRTVWHVQLRSRRTCFFTTSSIGLLFTSHAAVVFYMLYIRTSIRACAPSSPTYSHDSRHDKSTVAQRPGGALNNCMILLPLDSASGLCIYIARISTDRLQLTVTGFKTERYGLSDRRLGTNRFSNLNHEFRTKGLRIRILVRLKVVFPPNLYRVFKIKCLRLSI